MIATLKKGEFLFHQKQLKHVNLSKKLAESAKITISVADKFSITGPGFGCDMDCTAERWGTISMPYNVWKNIVDQIIPALKERKIDISGETFEITINGLKIQHPLIIVTRMDKLGLEIPPDAIPIEIVEFALTKDKRTLRSSVSWKLIKKAIQVVRGHIDKASAPVSRYGVTRADIAMMVADNRGIEDFDRFYELIFEST